MSSFVKMATFSIILHVVFYVALNMVYVPDVSSEAQMSDPNLLTSYQTLGNATGHFRFEPDLFDLYVKNDPQQLVQSIQDNWTEYATPNQSVIAVPNQVGGQAIGTNVVSFLDPLKIVYASLNTFLNIGSGPFAVLVSNKINPMVAILIGIPYIIVVFLTLLAFIRGVSD